MDHRKRGARLLFVAICWLGTPVFAVKAGTVVVSDANGAVISLPAMLRILINPVFVQSLSRRTLGADNPDTSDEFRMGNGLVNAYPRVGPIVITEIMYHPPDNGTNDNVADVVLEFNAVPNRSCTIEYSNSLESNNCIRLDDLPATPSGGPVQVTDTSSGGRRYYRLRTPQSP